METDFQYKSVKLESVLNAKDMTQFTEFQCFNCGEIPLEPYMCNTCSKNYCKYCIKTIMKEICKACKSKAKLSDGIHYYNIYFKKLSFRCNNFKYGCNEYLIYEDIKSHLMTCKFEKFKCLCGELIFTVNKVEHEEIQCPQKRIECEDCGKTMLKIKFQEHNKVCSERKLMCDSCNFVFKQNEFYNHQKKCGSGLVDCAKCKVKYERSDKNVHDCSLAVLERIEKQYENFGFNFNKKFDEISNRLEQKLSTFEQRLGNIEKHLIKYNELNHEKFLKLHEEMGNIKNITSNTSNLLYNLGTGGLANESINNNNSNGLELNKKKNVAFSKRLSVLKQTPTNSNNNFGNDDFEDNYYEDYNVNKEWDGKTSQIMLNSDMVSNDGGLKSTFKEKYTWPDGTLKIVHLNSYYRTTTCMANLSDIEVLNFKIVKLEQPKYFAIGFTDKIINESKAWLGVNFGKGNWALFGSGYCGEEGAYSKEIIGPKLKEGDIVTLILDNYTINFMVNFKKIEYEYTLHYKELHFAVSLMSKKDSVQLLQQ